MWHEARRQEKKIRGMIVDFKQRAARRKEYYARIKQDPTLFLRVYGKKSDIHYERAIVADAPQTMVPWQGDTENLIDRYDVRAHLYSMPEVVKNQKPVDEEEERMLNYERYRVLVQNDFTHISEHHCLQQIKMEEQLPTTAVSTSATSETEKKKIAESKAAISYTYDEGDIVRKPAAANDEEEEEESIDVEVADLDVVIDIDKLTDDHKKAVNSSSVRYGMKVGDFLRMLQVDKDEEEELKQDKLVADEKARFAGRNARRQRMLYKQRRLLAKEKSPLSFAKKELSPTFDPFARGSSSSRSPSPKAEGEVEFITSFGDGAATQGPELPPENMTVPPGLEPLLPIPINHKEALLPTPKRQPLLPTPTNISPMADGFDIEAARRSLRVNRSRSKSSLSMSTTSSSSSSTSRSRSRRSSRSSKTKSRSRSKKRSRTRSKSPQSRSRSKTPLKRSPSRSKSPLKRSRTRSKSPLARSRTRSKSPLKRSRSKSPLKASKSRSRSRSSRSTSTSRSRSRTPPRVKSYRRSSSSSTDSSDSGPRRRKPSRPNSTTKKPRLSMQDRMKLRMQMALSKQLIKDKKSEKEKMEKEARDKMIREDELHSMSVQMYRKSRDKMREREELERTERLLNRQTSDRSSGRRRTRSRSRSPRRRSRSPQRRRSRSPPHRSLNSRRPSSPRSTRRSPKRNSNS